MRNFILLFIFIYSGNTYSQGLEIDSKLLYKNYYNNGIEVSRSEFESILLKNEENHAVIAKSKSLQKSSYIFTLVSAISFVTYLNNGKDQNLFMGMGSLLMALISNNQSNKTTTKAIKLSNTGIGIVYQF